MKRYVQFFQNSTGYVSGSIPPWFDPKNVTLIPAYGDGSVVIIDGRIRKETAKRIAREECKKRGYIAWQFFEGQSFTDSRAVSGIYLVGE